MKGTLARIDAVLRPRQNDKPQEFRTDFIAEAVERELDRRAGIQARANKISDEEIIQAVMRQKPKRGKGRP